jgi:pyrroloquinoline quinone biosynthesis protein B
MLWPRTARDSPIVAIVLTNGDIDHVLGLFALRESQPLAVYATKRVLEGLERNVLLRTLRRFSGHVEFRPLALGQPVEIASVAGEGTGIVVEAFAAAGKPPIHLATTFAPDPEDNVGLLLEARTGGRAAYMTAARSADLVAAAVSGSGALLFDGTFFSEDELPRLGLGTARAADMAHVPIGGDGGSLALLGELPIPRRIYTHINNTNPILRRNSPERRLVEARGWEVAVDGLEIVL